jgi:prepilin-type N-terminal cleavage/methylation domain-containing protein
LRPPGRGERGFTLVELLVVVAFAGIIAAIALNPVRTYLASWDARLSVRNIVGQITLARMRAASNFSWSRVYCNTSASPQTCQVQVNAIGSNSATFTNESGATAYGGWGAQPLARTTTMVTAGASVGSIGAGAGGQSSSSPTPYTTISFNSRGMPIDTSTGALKSDYAIYLYSASMNYYAITVDLSGRAREWIWSGSAWTETDSSEQ